MLELRRAAPSLRVPQPLALPAGPPPVEVVVEETARVPGGGLPEDALLILWQVSRSDEHRLGPLPARLASPQRVNRALARVLELIDRRLAGNAAARSEKAMAEALREIYRLRIAFVLGKNRLA